MLTALFAPAVLPPGLSTTVTVLVDPSPAKPGAEWLGGVQIGVGLSPRTQGRAERGTGASLSDEVVVRVPVYFAVARGGEGDAMGRTVGKLGIGEDGEVRRKGFKIKTRAEKVEEQRASVEDFVYTSARVSR